MADKTFEPDDPMELVGVALPGAADTMAECIIEEMIREGFDDEQLLAVFRDPFYRATNRIYREKSEAAVRALIARLRSKWGYWKGDDIAMRLRSDDIKKQALKEVNHHG